MPTCPLQRTDCPLHPAPPKVQTFDLVVATLNVQRTLSTEKALADMYEAINWPTEPQILLMQEVQARDAIFHSFNKKSRYWAVHHTGYEHAIMWRKDILRSKKFGAVKMHSGKAKVSPDRFIAFDEFEVLANGFEFDAASTHAVSGVERGGTPRLARPWQVSKMKEHMVRMEAWVEGRPNPVILGGDFNVDARKDAQRQSTYFPWASMARAGMVPTYKSLGMPKGGTHGDRLIDWLAVAPHGEQIRAVSHGIMRDFYSDHHGLLARFRITTNGA